MTNDAGRKPEGAPERLSPSWRRRPFRASTGTAYVATTLFGRHVARKRKP